MTAPASGARRSTTDPWERLGTFMAAIWLVFLAFPLTQHLTSDEPWPRRLLLSGLIVLFAVVYAAGWWQDEGRGWLSERWAVWPVGFLGVATLPAVAMAVLSGLDDALAFVPYLAAIATWLLPLWWGPALGTVLTLLPVATYLAGWTSWGMAVPGALVLVTGIFGRVLMRRGFEHDRMQSDLRLSRERERVARDVHDVLGHSLTAVTVKADLAERLLHRDPERAAAELRDIQALTRTALAEIRETVSGLRTASLVAELDAATASLQAAGVRLEVHGAVDDVDPRFRTVLGWAVREAVTNVLRHAGATRCSILLADTSVEVVDDGRGRGGRGEGNGLRGIRERVAGAGGRVTVDDGPDGRGTRVRVEMERL